MNILSLDLSSKSSGYAVFKDQTLIDYGVITSASTDVIKRAYKMRDEIQKIMEKYPIDLVIAEEVVPNGVNPVVWKALTKVQCAVLFMIHDNFPKTEVEFILPNSWRARIGIHTGRGITRQTLKQKDIEFVNSTFGLSITSDDTADAIGIGWSKIQGKDPKVEKDEFGFEFK